MKRNMNNSKVRLATPNYVIITFVLTVITAATSVINYGVNYYNSKFKAVNVDQGRSITAKFYSGQSYKWSKLKPSKGNVLVSMGQLSGPTKTKYKIQSQKVSSNKLNTIRTYTVSHNKVFPKPTKAFYSNGTKSAQYSLKITKVNNTKKYSEAQVDWMLDS